MRFSYLVPRFMLLSLVWAFFAFAFDPMLRSAIVYSSQTVAGAKIDLDDFQSSFFSPALVAKNVRVANRFSPGKNLVEFDALRIQLDGRPLMKKSYLVKKASITGLKWNTQRSDSGRLDVDLKIPLWKPKLLDSLNESVSDIGQKWFTAAFSRAKQQLDPQQLETVQLAQQLEKSWTDRFEQLEFRVKNLETRTQQIRDDAKNVKGKGLQQIEAYAQLAIDVNNLLAEADSIRRELKNIPNLANNDLQNLDAARYRDQQAIQQKLEILNLDSEAITNSLLGPELKDRIEPILSAIEWITANFLNATDDYEPIRYRGIDVEFSRKNELPRFLIERLSVAGEAQIGNETFPFHGTIRGLTSDPVLYGKPATLLVKGKGTGHLLLQGIFDHTQPNHAYQLSLFYSLPKTIETNLGNPENLQLHLASGKTDCRAKLKLNGENLSGYITFRQAPLSIVVVENDEIDNGARQMLQSALSGIQRLETELTVSGTLDEPQWALRSNLGPQLADGINQMLAQQWEIRSRQLAGEIDQAAREKTAAFREQLSTRYGKVFRELSQNETAARRLLNEVAGGRPFDLKKFLRR